MATELQEFMKKVGKLSEHDYTIGLSSAQWFWYNAEFDICLIDYSQTTKLKVSYYNRESIDNLLEWLGENCDEDGFYRENNGNCRYCFEEAGFVVDVTYLSNLIE